MTFTYLRRGTLALVVQLLALAAPVAAQAPTARDSAHAALQLDDSLRLKVFPTLDRYCKTSSKTAYMRDGACKHYVRLFGKLSAAESLLVAYTAPPTPPTPPTPPKDSSVVVVQPDTTRDSVIVTPGAPQTGVNFVHPFGPPANGAILAALPQDTVDASYPTIARRIACSNLQACLDTAKTGDEIRLTPGASFTDAIVKPTSRALWTVVRTDITDAQLGAQWERMTARKAAALNLATIRSSGSSTAGITVASGAHHVRFVGVRVTTAAPQTNALVRIGLGESVVEQLPHHITLDRVVVDPGDNDLKRCVAADGDFLAILSSTLARCHSNAGDSQGVLKMHGRGPLRIENNTIQGGHQSVFLGGGDPSIRGIVPSDVVVRRNDLSRPASWQCTGPIITGTNTRTCLAGQWRTKTNVELKIGKRVLIEGNVICRTPPDAQSGYAVLLKTENQDGGTAGDWSESSDITVRYNRICGAGGGFNLAPLQQGPGVPMSRVAIYGNEADSIGVGPYRGDTGDALQLLGVADVVFQDNWIRNPEGRACIYSTNVSARFVGQRNVCGGQYGIRGEGGLAATIPSSILTANTVLPWQTAFGSWPASPSDTTRARLLSGVVVNP